MTDYTSSEIAVKYQSKTLITHNTTLNISYLCHIHHARCLTRTVPLPITSVNSTMAQSSSTIIGLD